MNVTPNATFLISWLRPITIRSNSKEVCFIFYCVPIHIPLYIGLSKICHLNLSQYLLGPHNFCNSFLFMYIKYLSFYYYIFCLVCIKDPGSAKYGLRTSCSKTKTRIGENIFKILANTGFSFRKSPVPTGK